MLPGYFTTLHRKVSPIILVTVSDFPKWLTKQPTFIQHWLKSSAFNPEPGSIAQLPDASGRMAKILFCTANDSSAWDVGALPFRLPPGDYTLTVSHKLLTNMAIAWGLGAYQFNRYKSAKRQPARLYLPKDADRAYITNTVSAIYLVRDLINTPTEDLGPSELAKATQQLGRRYKARFSQIVGKDLLKKNFPAIYTVGRASDDPPRLLELTWGNKKHPRIALVGKGVCFDTGGLNIKPSSAMLLMKKDMGGAAHVLGLAQMIMQAKLPVYLQVLIPAVENAIAGNAYRPGDVIQSRKGLTIEIGNTDAEGRVILADALYAAASAAPELLIDMSTLTGAARIAVGTEIAAVFANNDHLVNQVVAEGERLEDPLWRLPLYQPYRELINSSIADINNAGNDSYGGAITAALFLKEFIPTNIPWLHFDLMAWNLRNRPGRPIGGEAMGLRALFGFLVKRYGDS